MTYEQLLVLHAIVSEGTFRGAAERLHKSQSAVSHMLKKLEDDIGFLLLSREAYRPKLTAKGEVFYRQATRALEQMQQLRTTARNLNAKHEASVSLAVTATYPLTPVLNVISQVKKQYPTTDINLSRETMAGPLERLLEQQADIIIATMDGVPADQVEAIPFASITITPVAHPDHEAAQHPRLKTIQEMQSHTQIIVADSSSGNTRQSRDLLPGGLRWTVSDFAAKKEILLANQGWGGIPTHMIEEELSSGKLVPLNVEGYPPRHSQLFQIRRRDADTGIVAQAIWQQLAELQTEH
ncbi:LysR substrate-binding domain-containing protein [Aliamphritea spongicola]|uniref:LysR substrate-binding domain-containing protein n=1 Tax=Aliamphritea spongicola TaxID=707589 RepID=UPI00196A670A|nr:LysR family transcriptional regulator [Aliamphritea spongicola]